MSHEERSAHSFICESLDTLAERLEHIGNVLERHEPAPLPSKFARVHAMGQQSFTGEIEALPRGAYRITYLDSEVKEADYHHLTMNLNIPFTDDSTFAVSRVKDIRAIHSVDWLTQAEYASAVEEIQKAAAQNFKHLVRKSKMPEGYELVERPPGYHERFGSHVHGFRRLSDGRVHGFTWSPVEARGRAWLDSEGEFDDWNDESDLLAGAPAKPAE